LRSSDDTLAIRAADTLERTWRDVLRQHKATDTPRPVIRDPAVADAIARSVNSKTKTYRYVLPTQLLAKVVDPSLDSRCLQLARGGKGAFDARSLCHKIIVPFDKANHNVLGGSGEPYASNPVRIPEISRAHRSQQKNEEGWDDLCLVLDEVEKRQSPGFTKSVFLFVMEQVFLRLGDTVISYPLPRRVSKQRSQWVIAEFLADPSGGDRPLAVASALFATIGARFFLFRDIKRAKITAADAPSGMVADIECLDKSGRIVLAVEVKDRALTVSHIQDKLPGLRSRQVSEIFFLAEKGVKPTDESKVEALVEREFSTGQNIYIFTVQSLADVLLALVGEDGRTQFLRLVGEHLDNYGSATLHRKRWAELLAQV
jgi:hypothetical protein